MCKNSYYKNNKRTDKKMIYCHCFDKEDDDMRKLCLYQRYCKDKEEYVFNNIEKCKNYKE